jgi:HAD superfamily hydrolase (TIGR01490 family)
MVLTGAFFDVDETLIKCKSLLRFLRFDDDTAERRTTTVAERLAELYADGASRTELNRVYFRHFAGRVEQDVAVLGLAWFHHECQDGGLFDTTVLARLREHAAGGAYIVLVSGSFPPCLDPIAAYVGANAVLCTRPEVVAGRYTGEIATPMIGTAKVTAIQELAAARNISLDDSYAYADHISDLPMLRLVGHPVVVGADPALVAQADQHGWHRIVGTTGVALRHRTR